MKLFYDELKRQIEFALLAYSDLEDSMKSTKRESRKRIWYSIQSFLVATGNVSKIFWPNPKFKERGKELREKLKVADDSILKSRNMRNIFEHYDEKIEEFRLNNCARVDSNIGPINMIGNFSASDYLRHYVPKEKNIIFQGETYEILSIVKELMRIKEQLDN